MSLSESPMNGSSSPGDSNGHAANTGSPTGNGDARQDPASGNGATPRKPAADRNPHPPLLRPEAARPVNLLALLGALRRRWLLAATLGLVVAVVAAAAVWSVVRPPKATARAMVHIAAKPEAILVGRPQDPNDFANFQKTQMTVVKSQLVLSSALSNPDVAGLDIIQRQAAPLEWLMQEIEVDFTMGPEVLRISMKGDDAESLKVIVNGVMKAYLEEFINNEDTKRKEHLQHLKSLLEEREAARRAKRDLLEKFTPRLGTGDAAVLTVLHEIKIKQLANVKNALVVVQAELSKAEIDLKGLQKTADMALSNFAIPESEVEKQLLADALYVKNQERALLLEEEIAGVRLAAASPADADAALRRTGKLLELELAQKSVERRRDVLVPKITQSLRERIRGDLDAAMSIARTQIFVAEEKNKLLNKIINDLAAETKEVGKEGFEMQQARAELEEEEKTVRTLASQIRTLNTEKLAPSRARQLDRAMVVRAGKDRRLLLAGGAGGAALLLVLLAIAWREWQSRRIHSAEDVAHALGIRLVGTLPPLPRRLQNRLGQPGQADSTLGWYSTESIDTFRTFLLHDAAAHAIRTVMVTSAVAGEGKTSLACQLAISLARAGRKTLLIDSDLRRSSVHGRFDLAQAPGLAEVLRGQEKMPQTIQETSIPGLSVLSAGKGDGRAVQAMPERMAGILEEAKQTYDFVLIDSAPVLSVADPLLIGQHVDGVIFSTLRGVSRIPLAAAAQHRITALGIPSLGAVVSGTREELYNFGYQPAA